MSDTLATQLLDEMRQLRAELDTLRADLAARNATPTAVKSSRPEAYGLADAKRMLGGLGRSKIYQMVDDGTLDRVSGIRRLLITRRSIERFVSGRS